MRCLYIVPINNNNNNNNNDINKMIIRTIIFTRERSK